ncbi:MAG: heat-inducible transcriptional repressor HrcA [Candidatus Aminicenantes bacterium]|nr:heat-inducible transcriptional repressor HrcA [Candidatus Aminicenantes bacterium]
MQELRDKDRAVLSASVELYLKTGSPVSSGAIHQKRILTDSPATIRNIFVRLEEQGLLSQPHASSGRIPTDRGLRFYVNSLLDGVPLTFDRINLFAQDLSINKGDLPGLLHQASRVLADQSDSLGFVIQPRISRIHFHHIRFIQIAPGKVMIILMTPFQLVLTEIVPTETTFDQIELDRASQYINASFAGRTLSQTRDCILEELGKSTSKFERALSRLINLLKASIRQDDLDDPIIVQGASKLIGKFERGDMSRLKTLFQNIEEKASLAKLLSEFIALDRVKVLIGSESNLPAISDCALVLSHYGDRTQVLGSLGIIGPKRIPYRKIIPLVDNVAQKISQTISRASS